MPKKLPSCSAESPAGWAVLALAFGVAAVFFLSGCGAACDTSDEANAPEHYAGGTATGGVYESSPWKSGLLPFSGGKQYQLEHHLGFTPASVDIFIGFSADGERVAPCAGNSCLVRCVDDQMIWIKNDTCADFWVRVAAVGRSSESRGNACSGGGADGGSPTEEAAPAAGEAAADGGMNDQSPLPDANGVD